MTVSIFLESTGQEFYIASTLQWLTYIASLSGTDGEINDIIYGEGQITDQDIPRFIKAIKASDPEPKVTKNLLAALSAIRKGKTSGVLDTALGMGGKGEKTNKSDDREPFELVDYTGDDDADAVLFADAMVNKEFLRLHLNDIIGLLFRSIVPDSFKTLSPTQGRKAMETLVEHMTAPKGWSVSGVVNSLQEDFPGVERSDLRRIVRTESERVAVKAHELEAVENDPEDTRYVWRGPKDRRTCATHMRILRDQPESGLSLQDLKTFIAKEAADDGKAVQDDWLIHPNQRGSFRRVF